MNDVGAGESAGQKALAHLCEQLGWQVAYASQQLSSREAVFRRPLAVAPHPESRPLQQTSSHEVQEHPLNLPARAGNNLGATQRECPATMHVRPGSTCHAAVQQGCKPQTANPENAAPIQAHSLALAMPAQQPPMCAPPRVVPKDSSHPANSHSSSSFSIGAHLEAECLPELQGPPAWPAPQNSKVKIRPTIGTGGVSLCGVRLLNNCDARRSMT